MTTHISLDEDIDPDVIAVLISAILAGNSVDFLLPFTAATAAAASDLLRRGSLQEAEV